MAVPSLDDIAAQSTTDNRPSLDDLASQSTMTPGQMRGPVWGRVTGAGASALQGIENIPAAAGHAARGAAFLGVPDYSGRIVSESQHAQNLIDEEAASHPYDPGSGTNSGPQTLFKVPTGQDLVVPDRALSAVQADYQGYVPPDVNAPYSGLAGRLTDTATQASQSLEAQKYQGTTGLGKFISGVTNTGPQMAEMFIPGAGPFLAVPQFIAGAGEGERQRIMAAGGSETQGNKGEALAMPGNIAMNLLLPKILGAGADPLAGASSATVAQGVREATPWALRAAKTLGAGAAEGTAFTAASEANDQAAAYGATGQTLPLPGAAENASSIFSIMLGNAGGSYLQGRNVKAMAAREATGGVPAVSMMDMTKTVDPRYAERQAELDARANDPGWDANRYTVGTQIPDQYASLEEMELRNAAAAQRGEAGQIGGDQTNIAGGPMEALTPQGTTVPIPASRPENMLDDKERKRRAEADAARGPMDVPFVPSPSAAAYGPPTPNADPNVIDVTGRVTLEPKTPEVQTATAQRESKIPTTGETAPAGPLPVDAQPDPSPVGAPGVDVPAPAEPVAGIPFPTNPVDDVPMNAFGDVAPDGSFSTREGETTDQTAPDPVVDPTRALLERPLTTEVSNDGVSIQPDGEGRIPQRQPGGPGATEQAGRAEGEPGAALPGQGESPLPADQGQEAPGQEGGPLQDGGAVRQENGDVQVAAIPIEPPEHVQGPARVEAQMLLNQMHAQQGLIDQYGKSKAKGMQRKVAKFRENLADLQGKYDTATAPPDPVAEAHAAFKATEPTAGQGQLPGMTDPNTTLRGSSLDTRPAVEEGRVPTHDMFGGEDPDALPFSTTPGAAPETLGTDVRDVTAAGVRVRQTGESPVDAQGRRIYGATNPDGSIDLHAGAGSDTLFHELTHKALLPDDTTLPPAMKQKALAAHGGDVEKTAEAAARFGLEAREPKGILESAYLKIVNAAKAVARKFGWTDMNDIYRKVLEGQGVEVPRPSLREGMRTTMGKAFRIQTNDSAFKGIHSANPDDIALLAQAIQKAKEIRPEQAALYTAERGKRAVEAAKFINEYRGSDTLAYEAAALKGQLPHLSLEKLDLPKDVLDRLMDHIAGHNSLKGKDLTRFDLRHALENLNQYGELPQPAQIAQFETILGSKVAGAMSSRRPQGSKILETFKSANAATKALLVSFSDHAPLRQGRAISLAHPVESAKAFNLHMKAFFNADVADAATRAQHSGEAYKIRKAAGLYQSTIGKSFTPEAMLDENRGAGVWNQLSRLQGQNLATRPLAAVIRGIAHGVEGSSRAYTVYMNEMRCQLFDARDAVNQKLVAMGRMTPEELAFQRQQIAKTINAASGRSNIRTGALVDTLAFAPKFTLSRLEAPLREASNLVRTNGQAQRMSARLLVADVASHLATKGLVALAAGALTGVAAKNAYPRYDLDPTSPNFLDVTLDDKTKISTDEGFGPVMRPLARSILGYVTDKDGNTRKANDNEEISKFIKSHLAPVPGAMWSVATQKNFTGKAPTVGSVAADALAPISVHALAQAIQEYGPIGVFAAPFNWEAATVDVHPPNTQASGGSGHLSTLSHLSHSTGHLRH